MWRYNEKNIKHISDLPDDVIGFVYLIENIKTKEKYIGKKQLYRKRTKEQLVKKS